MLDWDEGEITAVFEAVPVVDDDGVTHTFTAVRDGAAIELVVAPYHNEVSVSIHVGGDDRPIYWSGLIRCGVLGRRQSENYEAVVARRDDETVLTVQVRPYISVSGAPVAV